MDTCSICCSPLDDDIGASTACGHCFHRTCFNRWKRSKSWRTTEKWREFPPCPICQKEVTFFLFHCISIRPSKRRTKEKQKIL
mmetsp:Transcript_40471/g.95072  ORF Transcript_40471/g.95072 Transcript_40471/m.95072 type:complete len:83 (-) Transcript_40471:704-952(-)